MVGCYIVATVGKDVYGQSDGGSCLGMVQGGVEHEGSGGSKLEKGTYFFWKAYDADPFV